MTVRLVCAACGQSLTNDALWGDETNHDNQCVDREPAVSAGFLVRLTEADIVPVWTNTGNDTEHMYSPAGAIAANPADILSGSLHSVGPDNGCCGSDGGDGPNRACRCGAHVATEWSDCWTQAEVRFLPEAVRVLEN